MAADLDPLIRLRKHVVEEKQRVVSQLYREVENLEKQKKVVQDQMAHEKKLAEEMQRPEALTFYGRYAEGARKKIEAIQMSIRKVEARIESAQEDMRIAFAEMKKVQITQTRREKREQKKLKDKEDALLDEVALDQYRRKVLEDEN
ncbi:MAG: hypothetical protein ACK4NR_05315 [Micavibrio sp.]